MTLTLDMSNRLLVIAPKLIQGCVELDLGTAGMILPSHILLALHCKSEGTVPKHPLLHSMTATLGMSNTPLQFWGKSWELDHGTVGLVRRILVASCCNLLGNLPESLDDWNSMAITGRMGNNAPDKREVDLHIGS
jgi:hypothetical protein